MKKFTDKFIDNNSFWLDLYSGEIILSKDKDVYAAPERYVQVGAMCDDRDYYIDTLYIDENRRINFSYSYEDSEHCNPNFIEMLYAYLESHGLPRSEYRVIRRIYPRKRFKKLLELYF